VEQVRIIADDYGLAPAVNQGIEELAIHGMIDGVSIMAHREADLTRASALASSGVELGLHLVFVEEAPLLAATAQAEGRLPSTYRDLFRLLLRRPSFADQLVLEAEAQLERVRELGLKLAFVNSHQHVHMFPALWRALRPLFERWRLRVRVARALRPGPAKQVLLETSSSLSWSLWPLAQCETVAPVGVDLAGKLDATGAERCARRRTRWNMAWPCELVVHPGHEDAALRGRYAHWGYRWSEEFALLADGRIRRALQEPT
jgi:predicted glycoside hydrolase/deacetylase ChbG (UPF0249 family)